MEIRVAERKARQMAWVAAALVAALGLGRLLLPGSPPESDMPTGPAKSEPSTRAVPIADERVSLPPKAPEADRREADREALPGVAPEADWRGNLPRWLVEAVDVEAGASPVLSNRDPALRAGGLDPRDLAALQDIIEFNGLHEGTSPTDYDNGDGFLEPLELGLQFWQQGRLVGLLLGPDPYWSFGYDIVELPPSIGDASQLRFLDLHESFLAGLPESLGRLGMLRELRLQGNQLSWLPAGVGSLQELRGLALGQNEFVALPETLGGLRRLERLQLGDNRLVELPAAIGRMDSLRVLGVAQTEAGGRGRLRQLPDGVETLPSLEALYVTGHPMTCSRALLEDGSVLVFGCAAP